MAASDGGPAKALRDSLSLVKFSHSIFALPFALQGAWLAAGGLPSFGVLGIVVLCAVAARTAAMAFNRLVDRRIDAENPRTAGRELPAGVMRPWQAGALVLVSSAVFLLGAGLLGPLCLALAPAVLAVLLGYSYVKRFWSGAHFVLGLALALAPLGAWLAVRGAFDAPIAPVLWLAGGVLTWVAGFDLIYACQDAGFDRGAGLHSIPARLGVGRALVFSSALHIVAVLCFLAQGLAADLGAPYWAALCLAAALLVWEHSIVSPGDLSRVDVAFFTLNGWVGVGLFVGLATDFALG